MFPPESLSSVDSDDSEYNFAPGFVPNIQKNVQENESYDKSYNKAGWS